MLPPVATNVYNLPVSPSRALRDGVLFICRSRRISRFSPPRCHRWRTHVGIIYTTTTILLLLNYYCYTTTIGAATAGSKTGVSLRKKKKSPPRSCHCCSAPPTPARPPSSLVRYLYFTPPLLPRRWLLTRFRKIESGARGKRRRDGLISGARIRRHL